MLSSHTATLTPSPKMSPASTTMSPTHGPGDLLVVVDLNLLGDALPDQYDPQPRARRKRHHHADTMSIATSASPPMKSGIQGIGLPVWILLGALAGVIAGVVLGERTVVLQPVGSAYAMMLQIAVYPYLLSSL